MNTSIYIAKRYLFSKKSLNAINFISGISILGVFVGSAALIIILSVFNGFETMILSMYNTFTPEINIEPAQGKTFYANTAYFNQLKHDKRIVNYTEVLQEKALVRYDRAQYIGLIKGVSDDFIKGKQLDSVMVQGDFVLKSGSTDFAVLGSIAQSYLTVNVKDPFQDIEIYSPRKEGGNAVNPVDAFNVMTIHPAGVFAVHHQFDEMILVPIGFARKLLNEDVQVSSIELNIKDGLSNTKMQNEIQDKLGDKFLVKGRIQQNQALYKVFKSEKWAIFMILTFVLIIAIFNIIGSLTMLVIDKRKDIAILSSIGADNALIRNIFFTEGMMISMIGCVIGMFAGLVFCLLQQQFGFIKMGEENMITDTYPVSIQWVDFLLVFFTVSLISVLASSISSRLSVKHIVQLKSDL